ncbi:MAG: glycosyltransferase, partial [Melioribacteraceae bacterium]|nr:glycosyltransferase [Melioribacteraceae bacterium]
MNESLTIIFPAFDEEHKISNDIKRAANFLESNNISGEIIVVDDGSKDKTFELASQLKSLINTRLIVLKHVANQGKGFAVRSGILEAQSDLILYSDVGGVVPLKNVLNGLKKFKSEKLDVLHGSRKLSDSIILKPQEVDRKISSWLINKIIRLFF